MFFQREKEFDYSLIQTSSKESLKRSALLVCGNDIKKASEIYDFFIKDMPNLPDVEPVAPNALDQMRDMAVGVFRWGQQNQDQIIGVVNMVLGAMGKNPIGIPAVPVTEVPPAPPVA
ncbi:MAG: hypothetical protein IJ882_08150 [Paludibacteraceae bacterium]|nr:hypothetical protein [Paludibacteraceae bacterium]MBR3647638.1 hypothetical protein [Paludibacteraceae bacterium]